MYNLVIFISRIFREDMKLYGKLNFIRKLNRRYSIKNEIMLKLIEEEALGDFVEKISKSNRIFVYGKGVSFKYSWPRTKKSFYKIR